MRAHGDEQVRIDQGGCLYAPSALESRLTTLALKPRVSITIAICPSMDKNPTEIRRNREQNSQKTKVFVEKALELGATLILATRATMPQHTVPVTAERFALH